MDNKEFAELHARAEAALTKIPGVVAVGYGLRVKDGRTTDERAFRVYVKEKKPLAQVPPGERIPEEFEGIPTDVLVVRDVKPIHCQDLAQHSPLIGGISIANFKNPGSSQGVGTLGFFATLDGVAGPKNVVLVSNHHVLAADGGSNGDTVYQPKHVEQGGQVAIVLNEDQRRPIAEINDIGIDANHPFTYPGESQQDYHVDCASAKLDISISSWCNTNCGVSYKNEIRGLNINGNSKIEDVARVSQADLDAPGDYVVVKVGRTTSKTVGRITDIAAAGIGGERRMIEIEPTQNDCDGIDQFAAQGDSGAALINAQNRLVGLLFAVDGRLGFADHIHPVLDRLKITAISTANPPVGPAGQALSNVEGFIDDGVDETVALRERFVATRRGVELYEEILRHREEVVELVNRHRPVTVAWHRAQGPAFLAHAVENARHPGHRIPREIEGVDRATLLSRMAEVLTGHGSGALAAAVAAHRAEVLALVDHFDDLHELVRRFEDVPVDA